MSSRKSKASTGIGKGSKGTSGKSQTQSKAQTTASKYEQGGGGQPQPTVQATPKGKKNTATKQPCAPSPGATDRSHTEDHKKYESQSTQTPPTSTQPPNTTTHPVASRPPYHHSRSVDGSAGNKSWQQQEPSRPRSRSFHFPWQSQSRYRVQLPAKQDRCPPDIEEYRKGYPTAKDVKDMNENYEFYTGKMPFRPKGVYIDKILEYWWGRYDILEHRHDYIQWLFPTQDGSGMSYFAQPLQKHEIAAICSDDNAMARVLESYKMMLDFYGMELADTGDVKRSGNWQERFAHLDHSIHNHMRITRILKTLGELNYEHLKAPFVRFILRTIFKDGHLVNTLESCMKYWVETIRDKDDRDSLWLLAEELDRQEHWKRR